MTAKVREKMLEKFTSFYLRLESIAKMKRPFIGS